MSSHIFRSFEHVQCIEIQLATWVRRVTKTTAGLGVMAILGVSLSPHDLAQTAPVYSHSSRDKNNLANGHLVYHPIVTDAQGKIVPWFSAIPGDSYDHVLGLVWNFWFGIRRDMNGLPYYMNHQIYLEDYNDYRGIGGDQFQVALESWRLYYGYSGNEAVLENMKFIADYYITHGFSPADSRWPNLPFSYNTKVYSGIYDGDMILGKDYVQPDKAGAFAYELLQLYKMTRNQEYLRVAVGIADTLSAHTQAGDEDHSPLPFKVNVVTGVIGELKDPRTGVAMLPASYTSSCAGTLSLYLDLIAMGKGDVDHYRSAFDRTLKWMKSYPMHNERWGPYYEDVSGWSDTQVNAANWVWFMLHHREYFPEWRTEANTILDWIYKEFGNNTWARYGVTVIDEQTSFRYEGSSHSAHQAAVDLLYARLTGDNSRVENAVRMLNWATYMVDIDGKNQYPVEGIWMTDGYGDYVRHYLRAMSEWPDLMPPSQNHLMQTSTAIKKIEYWPNFLYGNWAIALDEHELAAGKQYWPRIHYLTAEKVSQEVFYLAAKPVAVQAGDRDLHEAREIAPETWTWQARQSGGLLTISHEAASDVKVIW
jgi:hypothetical protein